jgi:hypothetical protein
MKELTFACDRRGRQWAESLSATLGLEIESVDQDLSQVGGVDPWNSAAVTS